MLLQELHGYHRYLDMNLSDILNDLYKKHDHMWDSGSYGVVLLPKGANFVYKAWVGDAGYEGFLDLVLKHQNNPFFPKVLGKPKKLPVFFKRPADVDVSINIIKLEKLYFVADDLPRKVMKVFQAINYLHADELTLDWLKSTTANMLKPKSERDDAKRTLGIARDQYAKGKMSSADFNDTYRNAMNKLRDLILSEKKLQQLDLDQMYETMKLLIAKKFDSNLKFDVHSGNFMCRPNGDLVITDPFVGTSNLIQIGQLSRTYDGETKTGRSSSSRKSESERKDAAS